MAKGYEEHRNERKKPKLTLKEKRQRKREKKMREQEARQVEQHPDVFI